MPPGARLPTPIPCLRFLANSPATICKFAPAFTTTLTKRICNRLVSLAQWATCSRRASRIQRRRRGEEVAHPGGRAQASLEGWVGVGKKRSPVEATQTRLQRLRKKSCCSCFLKFQGLKPSPLNALTARVNACPDTKQVREKVFPQPL